MINKKNRMNTQFTRAHKNSKYFLVLVFIFLLGACSEEEGPAEQAGEEIDETIQQLQTDAKDAKQEIEEETEEVINDAERTAEDIAD